MKTMTPNYSTLDAALEIALDSGPELSNGFTSHAPMATEALCAMGRADAVIPWIENYRRQFTARPRPSVKIAPAQWRDALGLHDRFADWAVFFQDQMNWRPWTDVVREWGALLAPGLAGAATHGIIRAGHAVRGLANEETPIRRRELADGLAYWAATYEELPERHAAGRDSGLPSRAINAVPLLPSGHGHFHTIVEALVQLDDFPAFAGTISLVDVSGPVSPFLSDLTATFARAYLANARDIVSIIAFIHTVTAPAALRTIARFLDTAGERTALPFAWQTSAAIYAVYAAKPPQPESTESSDEADADALIQSAIECADEHAIKFTEACLREHAIKPNPSYLAAARHAVATLTKLLAH
jgi:hypothetical protein